MERRFTGFLIPILIATLVWLIFFSNDKKQEPKAPPAAADPSVTLPAVQKQIAAQPQSAVDASIKTVRHLFGELPSEGKPGHGFDVRFSRYGAGIKFATLNDHFATPKATRLARTDPDKLGDRDYYAIVPAYPPYANGMRSWGYGMVLEGAGENRFPKAIDDGAKNQVWEVEAIEGSNVVRFWLDMKEHGLRLEKIFRYDPAVGRRDLQVDIKLYLVADRKNQPSVYNVGLRGVHIWNPRRARVFSNPAVAVGAKVDAEGTPIVGYFRAKEADPATVVGVEPNQSFDFAGSTSRFFGGFLFAADRATAARVSAATSKTWPPVPVQVNGKLDGAPTVFKIEPKSVPEVTTHFELQVPTKVGEADSLAFRLYLGPKSTTQFEGDYERFLAVTSGDFDPANTGCCCPVPGVKQLAQFLTWLLKLFHSLVGNWGVAIIMLTILVRATLSPLNFNMQRTMRAHGAKMAKLKPKMEAIQKQYKDDPKAQQMEMMKFNKEHKLISAPLKGCLPILVTMPIWFGLFTSLRVMYELRHEGFFGWIVDLSTPDRLFATGFAWEPAAYFNLLPIIMVSLWIYLQMGTPLPKDSQQRQMMVMMRFMPLMMGVMLYNYAAGLMVYMCTSSVWGIIEQKITKKVLGPAPDTAGTMTPQMPML